MRFNNQLISQLIDSVRTKKNTYADIALDMKLSIATVNRLKEGKEPSIDTLIIVAMYFNKRVEEFFIYDESEKQLIAAEPSVKYQSESEIITLLKQHNEFLTKQVEEKDIIINGYRTGDIVSGNTKKTAS